jgi:hypothetical protein
VEQLRASRKQDRAAECSGQRAVMSELWTNQVSKLYAGSWMLNSPESMTSSSRSMTSSSLIVRGSPKASLYLVQINRIWLASGSGVGKTMEYWVSFVVHETSENRWGIGYFLRYDEWCWKEIERKYLLDPRQVAKQSLRLQRIGKKKEKERKLNGKICAYIVRCN